MQQWQDGVGKVFVPAKDKHICCEHFAEDQFCKSHDLFLAMAAGVVKGKRKLIPTAVPSIVKKGAILIYLNINSKTLHRLQRLLINNIFLIQKIFGFRLKIIK